MFSPRWQKVVRDVWLHRGRTVLVVLAMAAGLAGAGVILTAWAIVDVATRDGYLASNPASATIGVDSVDAATMARVLARMRARADVRDVQARRTTAARVQVGGSWFTAILYTVEDFSAVTIGTLRPEVGAWPPDDASFIIERSSLDLLGATVTASCACVLGSCASGGAPGAWGGARRWSRAWVDGARGLRLRHAARAGTHGGAVNARRVAFGRAR